jgi:hypothetical protein
MKMEYIVQPDGSFRFDAPDRIAAFARAHGMGLLGHTLVWYAQAPGGLPAAGREPHRLRRRLSQLHPRRGRPLSRPGGRLGRGQRGGGRGRERLARQPVGPAPGRLRAHRPGLSHGPRGRPARAPAAERLQSRIPSQEARHLPEAGRAPAGLGRAADRPGNPDARGGRHRAGRDHPDDPRAGRPGPADPRVRAGRLADPRRRTSCCRAPSCSAARRPSTPRPPRPSWPCPSASASPSPSGACATRFVADGRERRRRPGDLRQRRPSQGRRGGPGEAFRA